VNQGLCAATDTIVLHFINPPVINLGNDTFVCSPNPVTLNAQNNGNSYLWNSGQTTQSITVNNPGTYWVIVNNGSCSRTDSINISVVTPPVLNPQFVADTTKGCNPLTINFTNNSSGGTSYIWKYGDNTALGTSLNVTHTYTDTGVFTVTLTIINDTSTVCGTYIDSLVISHYIAIADPIHITSNFSGSPLSGCTPLIVNFTNRSTNGANYIWNFGNGMSISDTGNVETIYEFAGTYKITLVASNYNDRCYNAPDSMSIDVTVDSCDLFIPNVFSPNGDGRNDNYEFNAEGYANFHLIIFDRWGLKIFESTDNSIKWNGQINNSGSNAPDGTYYYIFNSIDPNGQPYANHGFLTLIR
jgi:gliding motility-associated-like protein